MSTPTESFVRYLRERGNHFSKLIYVASVQRKLATGEYDPALGVELWLFFLKSAYASYRSKYPRRRRLRWQTMLKIARQFETNERFAIEQGLYKDYTKTGSVREMR